MNINQEYYKATELQLVTMTEKVQSKRTPIHEVRRLNRIVFDMLIVCSSLYDGGAGEMPDSQQIILKKCLEGNMLREYYDHLMDVACEKHQKTVEEQNLGGYADRD